VKVYMVVFSELRRNCLLIRKRYCL